MHQVVFDSSKRFSSQRRRRAVAHKEELILEVADHDVDAKLRTDMPNGTLTLEDVRVIGNQREVLRNALDYQVQANGKLSISKGSGRSHKLQVDFDIEFECKLTTTQTTETGSYDAHLLRAPRSASHVAETPTNNLQAERHYERPQAEVKASTPIVLPDTIPERSMQPNATAHSVPTVRQATDTNPRRASFMSGKFRLSNPSAQTMKALMGTDAELAQIEVRVQEIAAILGEPSPTDLTSLKSELAQLETQAKKLETKGVDDVYTGELNSGKQMAKDAKRDMLRRFEHLFASIEDIFATLKLSAQREASHR
jgi:hypothetical protein